MGLSQEGQAFLLVIGAGLCTAIGASVVFFPFLANLAKPHVLAISLSFASGIMVYISLVDIYPKAIVGFAESGYEDGDSFIYATLAFFGGFIIMILLDQIVDVLLAWDSKRKGTDHHHDQPPSNANTTSIEHHHATLCGAAPQDANALNEMREKFETKIEEEEEQQQRGEEGIEHVALPPSMMAATSTNNDASAAAIDDDDDDSDSLSKKEKKQDNNDNKNGSSNPMIIDTTKGEEGRQLTHMSWAMAASIAIHNLPEGMVTYLAYLSDNAVGVALAIGIAVHNIPEGLCVSMPLYYATGRRFYSFMWGTMSGLTEPIGALIVYLILQDGVSGLTNGILFGIVAGMMTVISIDELLPTAHKYAANPKHVTYTFLIGMLFIAASLMLFSV